MGSQAPSPYLEVPGRRANGQDVPKKLHNHLVETLMRHVPLARGVLMSE